MISMDNICCFRAATLRNSPQNAHIRCVPTITKQGNSMVIARHLKTVQFIDEWLRLETKH